MATKTKLEIQLGDILTIDAPRHDVFKGGYFMVQYIDKGLIEVLRNDNGETYELRLDKGAIQNYDVEGLGIVYRQPERGYARQNGLLPGEWITIRYGGEAPAIVHGRITDLEEDMITYTTYPGQYLERKTRYIDFAYRGIPRGSGIESISLRAPIEDKGPMPSSPSGLDASSDSEDYSFDLEGNRVKPSSDTIDLAPQEARATESSTAEELQKDVDEGNDILGQLIVKEVLDIEVEELIESDKRRVDLETQLNHMLETMKSKREEAAGRVTQRDLRRILDAVDRFKHLREQFSVLDESERRLRPLKRGANYKPIVEAMHSMEQQLSWFLPVANEEKYSCPRGEGADEAGAAPLVGLDRWASAEAVGDGNTTYDHYVRRAYGAMEQHLSRGARPQDGSAMDDAPQDPREGALGAVEVRGPVDAVGLPPSQDLSDHRSRAATVRYTEGARRPERESRVEVRIQQVVPNDTVFVKSFLTLPRAFREHSRARLPESSILTKSHLAAVHSRIHAAIKNGVLRRKTYLGGGSAGGSDSGGSGSDSGAGAANDAAVRDSIRRMTQEMCEHILETDGDFSQSNYRALLEKVVPRTRDIIAFLGSNSLLGALNIRDALAELEPFLIYKESLSFAQYRELVGFLRRSIRQLSDDIAADLRRIRPMVAMRESLTPYETALFALGVAYDDMLFAMMNSRRALTDQEFLQTAVRVDGGRTLYDIVAMSNVALYAPPDVAVTVEDALKRIEEEDKMADKKDKAAQRALAECENAELAKRYGSVEEMLRDNGRSTLSFDREFDHTRYGILGEYAKEQQSMSGTEFLDFLARRLVDTVGVPPKDAMYEADAIIRKRRPLREGNYAAVALDGLDQFGKPRTNRADYYVWRRNKWTKDETITKAMYDGIMNNPDKDMTALFCNVKDKCFLNKNRECTSLDGSKADMRRRQLEEMRSSLGEELAIKTRNMERELKRIVEENFDAFKKRRDFQRHVAHEHTRNHYFYGLKSDLVAITESPHARLRDRILGDSSDKMRQMTNLMNFARLHARQPIPDSGESENWMYCVDTQTKLLPMFFLRVADAYLTGGDVDATYDAIVRRQGKQVDGMIVDVHSGYVIRNIDMSTDEGYTEEGFRAVTREVIEEKMDLRAVDQEEFLRIAAEDAIEADRRTDADGNPLPEAEAALTAEERALRKSEVGMHVRNVIGTIGSYVGIPLDVPAQMYVIREVNGHIAKLIGTAKQYNKLMEKYIAVGKKVEPYDSRRNKLLMLFSGIYYLVAVQTSIPHLKTRKTFPGCSRDFGGAPMFDGHSGLHYIACVMKKLSSKTDPWSSIARAKEDKLLSLMLGLYEKHVAGTADLRNRVARKEDYLRENADALNADGAAERSIEHWHTFMPRLHRAGESEDAGGKLLRASEFSTGAQQALRRDLKAGLQSGQDGLDALTGRIFLQSAHILSRINAVVAREDALLSSRAGEAFLENACCQTPAGGVGGDPLAFFTERDGEIRTLVDRVDTYQRIIYELFHRQQPPRLVEPSDTKLKYPSVNGDEFAESTVYLAFIKYCRFGTGLPVAAGLKGLCRDNATRFSPQDSLEEKIEAMKADGHLFTTKSVQALVRSVNASRVVRLADQDRYTAEYTSLHAAMDAVSRAALNAPADRDGALLPPGLRALLLRATELFGELDPARPRALSKKLAGLNEQLINITRSDIVRLQDQLARAAKTAAQHRMQRMKRADRKRFADWLQRIGSFSGSREDRVERMGDIQYLRQCAYTLARLYPACVLNADNPLSIQSAYSETEDAFSTDPSALFKHWKLSDMHMRNLFAKVGAFYKRTKISSATNTEAGGDFGQLIEDAGPDLALLDALPVMSDIAAYAQVPEGGGIVERLGELSDREQFAVLFGHTNAVAMFACFVLRALSRYGNNLAGPAAMLMRQKDIVDTDRQTVLTKGLRVKELEKDTITGRLERMTDEERRADNEMKRLKLGRWGLGAQKGLFRYSGGRYDAEVQEDVQRRYGIAVGDVGADEMGEDEGSDVDPLERAGEIEEDIEAFDMSGVPDDDDAGERDDEYALEYEGHSGDRYD
jgi:hypothetical protein